MKTSTLLSTNFINNEDFTEWDNQTCGCDLLLAYDRNEQLHLMVYWSGGCKIYNQNGFKMEIKTRVEPYFHPIHLEENFGYEVLQYLSLEAFLPGPVRAQLIYDKNLEYFWAIDSRPEFQTRSSCITFDGKTLKVYAATILLETWTVGQDQSVQDFLKTKNLSVICPG
jgi:hypothetical protein